MTIKVVTDEIALEEVRGLAQEFYVTLIKGVVDVEREIVALGGEYHMDANIVLLEQGSRQASVWGFNLRLDKDSDDWIEYTSLINIRPEQGNREMELRDEALRARIREILGKRIKRT